MERYRVQMVEPVSPYGVHQSVVHLSNGVGLSKMLPEQKKNVDTLESTCKLLSSAD